MHEHITGGGWPAADPPPPLFAEALALARGAVDAFRSWGRFPVVATRDPRYAACHLSADEVVPVEPETCLDAVAELAERCGAALVVAPETGGVLERVSSVVEGAGASLLGSSSSAVAVAADKWSCGALLRAAALPTPPGVYVAADDVAAAAADLGYPVVVKPVRGAGCEGVALAADAAELEALVDRFDLRASGPILVQSFVDGDPVSVSLLVAHGRSRVLGLNSQHTLPGAPFVYRGGVAGIRHPRHDEACRLARAAVALVHGLKGYVGVDLVLGEQGCSVIEINARLTTSFLGLRRALDLDLAEALWTACADGRLPGPVRVLRPVSFAVEGDYGG